MRMLRKFSFKPTIQISKFISQYSSIDINQKKDEIHKIGGRIVGIRNSSKTLSFIDLSSNGEQVQVVFNSNHYQSPQAYQEHSSFLKRGNHIGVTGLPFKTKVGKLSLLSHNMQLLAQCHHQIPILNREDKEMLTNTDTRFSHRFLDFWVNKDHMQYFTIRRDIIKILREYLDENGFLEVETPILSSYAGGALAKPFKTSSNEIGIDLELRISPELYLKELIVSGFEKIYEIGKVFRNEGIDSTHNPEFTSCEFYEAYSNYEDLMSMTETLLKRIVSNIKKKLIVGDIDFAVPFKRVDVMTELCKHFDYKLDLQSINLKSELLYLLSRAKLINEKDNSITMKKLFDKAIEIAIEQKCKQPTFIMHHPRVISPLALPCSHNPLITERFELFIDGVELINAYSELNDHTLQEANFKYQKQIGKCDNESFGMDQHFIDVLSYGLPPTAGWGMGIDRLCRLLCGVKSMKEIILFPPVRKPLS